VALQRFFIFGRMLYFYLVPFIAIVQLHFKDGRNEVACVSLKELLDGLFTTDG
jgi:hypothetical protein